MTMPKRLRTSRHTYQARRRRLFVEGLENRQLLAADFELLKDINTGPANAGSNPQNFVQVGATIFFTASTSTHGTELWKTDGTEAGTTLVKDIRAGTGSSSPHFLTNFNDTLFFRANDGTSGYELWKSDGTEAGTVLVKDIRVGTGSSYPSNLTNVNGTLYFSAFDGTSGHELWKSDGTDAGTVRVKDIRAGNGGSYPYSLTNVNGTLFFRAEDGTSGLELWKSDGTETGTVLVKDIRTGNYNSSPSSLTNVNGTLFFGAFDGTTGYELWKSDGTEAGTVRVKDIRTGNSAPSSLTNVNGTLYFRAIDGTSGYELWKSDGTEAGTVRVKDISAGNQGSYPFNLTNVNGTLYFNATDGTSGRELWKSDGTEAGTVRIKDIRTGNYTSNPSNLTNVNGTLYFRATDGTSGFELWKSDGTDAGTVLVKDIIAGAGDSNLSYLTNVNGTLYFSAIDGTNGKELWKSDGTDTGTVRVKDIRSGNSSSYPFFLTNVNGTLFFSSFDGTSGQELWKSDGTETETVLFKDISAGSGSSNPSNLTNVNGTLFFIAFDGTSGQELWKSDGTETGTVRVKDIRSGTGSSTPRYLTNVNGTLFFSASDSTSGYELWKSDGTEAGTVRVKDIRGGTGSSTPRYLTNVNGTLFFRAFDTTKGTELWKSDGTEAGTVRVKDIEAGIFSSYPQNLTNVNGTLFFRAFDTTNGTELWKSDGTESGTVRVKDIVAGAGGSNPFHLTNVSGTVFFSASDGTSGQELWKSDGTEAGTVRVKDIRAGNDSSNPVYLTNVNGTLYFRATDGTSGYELWKSDGTEAGTVRVKDIFVGANYSSISGLTNVNGKLYFRANNGIDGEELWESDGTESGTQMVFDFTQDSGGSNPRGIIEFNGKLIVTSTTEAYGTELFISVTNSAPTDLSLSTSSIAENVSAGSTIGTLSTTDPDAGNTFTYTLATGTGDTDNADFTITGDQLTINASPNFEAKSSYSIRVRSTDQGGLFTEQEFLISVSDLNEDPTALALSASSIAENVPAGSTIGTFSTTDTDAGNTFTYTLVTGTGDTHNGDFTITGDQLTINASPNFEAKSSYSIRVRTTDQGGLFTEQEFLISVSDLNEDPTALALSASSIAENVPAGSAIGTFSTTDPDAGNTFTYTLVTGTGDTDNADFTVTGDQLTVNASPNFEANSSYSIRVRTTDQGGLFTEQEFLISVSDLNEDPTALALSASSIAENVSAGSAIGTLSTTDPDAGNTFTYTLVTGTGDTDNADFTISGDQLTINASPNFETKPSYSIRVRTTDQGGLFTEQELIISVDDLNEAPTEVQLSNTTVQENSVDAALVGLLSAVDPDAGDSWLFSLPAGALDNQLFSIVGQNSLVANHGFDFETQSSYQVVARATDAGGLSYDQTLTITIVDINEAPVLDTTPLQLFPSINEDNFNSTGQTVLALVSGVTDVDAGSLQGIAIVGVTGSTTGRWQYTLDGGTTWINVGTVSVSASLLLPSDTTFAKLRYVPNANFNGEVRVTYRAWDQTIGTVGSRVNTATAAGITAFSAAIETATLTVTPVNDAPVLDTTPVQLFPPINEDTFNSTGQTILSLVSGVSDVDAGSLQGIAIVGVTGSTTGRWQYTLNGGTTWINVGTVSVSASLLLPSDSTLTKLRYLPNANFNGEVRITYRAWDQTDGTVGSRVNTATAGGITAFSGAIETAAMTVSPVNDAPVLDTTPVQLFPTINEDTFNSTGQTILSLVSGVTDLDAGSLKGIAIVGVTGSTTGRWQYTLNGGTTWINVGTVSSNASLLLPSNSTLSKLRYVPNANYNGTVHITYRAWDQTTGIVLARVNTANGGGITAFSRTIETATQTVTAINDAPVLDAALNQMFPAINEDTFDSSGQTIAALVGGVSDVDVGARKGIAIVGITGSTTGRWQYTLNGGTTWINVGTVSVSASLLLPSDSTLTKLRYVPNANFNGEVRITFRAWDQTSGTVGTRVDTATTGGTTAFSTRIGTALLTVRPVNDAPQWLSAMPIQLGTISNSVNSPIYEVSSLLNGFVSDADRGALQGIAITTLMPISAGTLWYQLNGSTVWTQVTDVSSSSSLLLPSDAKLQFRPAAGFLGTFRASFRVWDRTTGAIEGRAAFDSSGSTGGETAFSSLISTAELQIIT